MIKQVKQIPITEFSYPFASAEKYCNLSACGYEETEYYMYGTANVYRSKSMYADVEIMTPDAPYVNRIIVRAPLDPAKCSGNVVVEIINPTSFMEIDRMWILSRKEFIRNGDIYVGITSKPNTFPALTAFDTERYGCLSWKNPTPDVPLPFTMEDVAADGRLIMPDIDPSYEPGLFWDMLTDLAWLLRSDDEMNPIRNLDHSYIYLTGWSQSADYLFRYVNSFAYRPEVRRDGCVFDGYLAGGCVRNMVTPVSQYEALKHYGVQLQRLEILREPFIAVQTESENGRFGAWRVPLPDSNLPDFKYRLYEITGASHDTMYSYVDYYQNDPDLARINHMPAYNGKNEEGNDYPSWLLFAGAFHNLYRWVREGVAPVCCSRIPTDIYGENKKDAFGNTIGGIRTCLLNYPTGRYNSTSTVDVGTYFVDPTSDKDGLFGYQESFSSSMLKELYGTIENYEKLIREDTNELLAQGIIVREDSEELIQLAMNLAKRRGLN